LPRGVYALRGACYDGRDCLSRGSALFKLFRRSEKTEQGVKKTRETLFGQVLGLLKRSSIDEALWGELEEALIAADVGAATAARLVESVRERVRREGIRDPEGVRGALQAEVVAALTVPYKGPLRPAESGGQAAPPKPLVILVVGVNGTGKTTSIAKLSRYFRDQDKSLVLAAADTFRAAAIDQIKVWGERVGAPVIAHQPGADPSAVAFDALQAARNRNADVLIIDTAGRLHTKSNLMDELKKVRRVLARLEPTAPHEVLLVLDATTGQNAVAQGRVFAEAVGVTGLVLTKLDGTAKGGVVIPLCQELKVPILFIGTGEQADDFAPFQPEEFAAALFAP